MAKKYYKKSQPKKKTKEIPVCGECLLDPTDSDLKEGDFYWVLKEFPESPSMNYYFLSCVNCIEKQNYIAAKPYKKKRGRKKKTE
jgi:hypothetical protein